MCGIAGVLDMSGRAVDRTLLKRMCDRLRHRGPDGEGYYWGDAAAVGHRRLSIIDLVTGDQPMSNEDQSVWVTFNGEIYNFAELRDELERHGHRFVTKSDTEVIIHAYEQYGERCVDRFRGMFAIALWDVRRARLFLARDRLGKKPLFYAEAEGQFVFASELQGVLQHPGVRREIDPTAIDDYLTFGYIPAPKTAFMGVRKLPPAHTLTVEVPPSGTASGECQPRRYWDLPYGPKLRLREQEAAERLEGLLSEAVRLRLIADVPLGALLSGGMDSSVVVALMSRHSSRPVKTFSIGFEEQEFDELPYARQVAERYGTEHHEFVVRPSALSILPTLVRHYGEPFADSSAVPTYYVSQLTRQHVTVALNGDGGDECLAGYERYQGAMLGAAYQRIPRLLRRALVEPVGAVLPLLPASLAGGRRGRQLQHFLEVAEQPLGLQYLRWITYFSPAQKQELYDADFRRCLGGYDGRSRMIRELEMGTVSGEGWLDSVLRADVRSYLAGDLLVKMDIAAMANSLETRSPFLDHEVMEFCARLPARFKLRGTTSKYLLKAMAKDLLPRQTVTRRKMGFGVPVGRWMRGELRPLLEDALLSDRGLQRGYVQPATVRRYVQEHLAGTRDHTFQLWSLLWLELWQRECVDR